MDSESLKVPLHSDILIYKKKKRCDRNYVFVLLIFVSLSLMSFTTYTFYRLQKLEYEFDLYRNKTLSAVKIILDDDLYNLLDRFEHDDEKFSHDSDDAPQTEKINTNYDYYGDYNLEDELNSDDISNDDEQEVKRILLGENLTKEGKEHLRKKRNVVAATRDGVLINSESYAEIKRRNNTVSGFGPFVEITPVSARPSVYGSIWTTRTYAASSTPTPVYSRQSRVMHLDDKSKAFKQIIKRPMLKSGDLSSEDSYASSEGAFIIRDDYSRRRQKQRSGLGRIKPLPSIRFDGDTSKYVMGQHSNFNGNGHMKHPRKTYIDWKAKDWVSTTGMDQHFQINEDGELTIKETGLYFIYAQIYYLDEHDTNGYRVYKNGDETILQCTITSHSMERIIKGNTCYTAGVEYLSENDVVSLGDLADGRYSLFEPGKSFFGVVKLGDIKAK